jgi:hypothetical protein
MTYENKRKKCYRCLSEKERERETEKEREREGIYKSQVLRG